MARLVSGSPTSSPLDASALLEEHERESAAIRLRFETTGDGRAAAAERSAWIDSILRGLFRSRVQESHESPGFTLAALGGYGRGLLFPHSDIDVLFLCGNRKSEERCRSAIGAISRTFWDLRLRISPATRTLAECGRFDAGNLEFSIGLLDCRYLAGDAALFAELRDTVIPHLVARERRDLVRALRTLTLSRHAAQGNTIFHLEPNLKDAPGGLRDYGVARWLSRIAGLDGRGGWAAPESLWPAEMASEAGPAFDFLAAARCFVHYRRKRDDNVLTYELQDEAAISGIGVDEKEPVAAADWMRRYFRNARAIHHLTTHLLEEIPPARSSLYDMFEGRRSRLSNEDFSVARGRVFLRRPAVLDDPAGLVRLFEFLARHGLPLSGEARRQVDGHVSLAGETAALARDFWPEFRRILLLPHAAAALRAMHRGGLLVLLVPEFRAIDALVIRDFYHRYTVDEHSFLAIENLHRLRRPDGEWERRYWEILEEVEQPELLHLSLLLHDVGKGMTARDHIDGSLAAAETALARLSLTSEERDTVRFLIASHLEMSATLQRRDIFDPGAVRDLARIVGTPERLKMLCLFTYADIRSVNPEALTPWKAEMLWQLYVATVNHLDRGVDEDRLLEGDIHGERSSAVLNLLPAEATEDQIARFLVGFPRRYFASHSPERIAAHYRMALRLGQEPFQIALTQERNAWQLTLLTRDRPKIFVSVVGTLFAWGMSIAKAEAFASTAGVICDTFHFADLFRTLEMNPSECGRFEENLRAVLNGTDNLTRVLARRTRPGPAPRPKVRVPTKMRFDNECSTHSTVVEIIAQDRPGLLYEISAALAEAGCNIEVALIDTEGPKVIDVFYLTSGGRKLSRRREEEVSRALRQRLPE
ncbi:MAG: [protein-PII] uridylyltransferase [Acidobacteriota bacterium]|nr:[protein-PII] uridylyltransferase [Acidobacteriota bacterium]